MTDFRKFSNLVAQQYNRMAQGELYTVDLQDNDEIWREYLSLFPEGTNEIFRERTWHDCQCCRQFVRNLGSVVAIKEGKIQTVWDIKGAPYPYQELSERLGDKLRGMKLKSIYRTTEDKFGHFETHSTEDGEVKTWEHFEGIVQSRHKTGDIGSAQNMFETSVGVFRRGLEELDLGAMDLIIEMIREDETMIYRGSEHLNSLLFFRAHLVKYHNLPEEKREMMIFEDADNPAVRFKNTVMGTLISDISKGKTLQAAVKSFEAKVAPQNYKRPKALVSKRQVEDAFKTVEELGIRDSLERRHAKVSDVSVKDVLFVDRSIREHMQDSLFNAVMGETKPPKQIDENKVEAISIDEFMEKVVPGSTSMEMLIKGEYEPNFVSITAPSHSGEPKLFKWENDFSWSYAGNLADSSIKSRVKKAGGDVSAPFRVSLAWMNLDDLDIHVYEPDGTHIYYGNRGSKNNRRHGFLDIDMNVNKENATRDAVENVCWQKPMDGVYVVKVHNFTRRESKDFGFQLEVENNGAITQYSYNKTIRNSASVEALKIQVEDGQIQSVTPHKDIVSNAVSKDVWGVKTQEFTKVKALMKSPNHWGDKPVGNKHWFFILENCLNPDPVRGMYNEYLRQELTTHRKVLEILADKTMAEPVEEQLSGVGFSSTKKTEVLVKVRGEQNRMYNVII